MKEHPILFNGPMVRAILEGRKTQTRRVVKTPDRYRNWTVGDQLWVRETFSIETNFNTDSNEDYPPPFKDGHPVNWIKSNVWGDHWQQAHYKASDPPPELSCETDRCRVCPENDGSPHWKPSIHMPRWASRITLEITDIRTEMLFNIPVEDAIAEGCSSVPEFADLWDSINEKRGYGWSENPDVVVNTFRMVKP